MTSYLPEYIWKVVKNIVFILTLTNLPILKGYMEVAYTTLFCHLSADDWTRPYMHPKIIVIFNKTRSRVAGYFKVCLMSLVDWAFMYFFNGVSLQQKNRTAWWNNVKNSPPLMHASYINFYLFCHL